MKLQMSCRFGGSRLDHPHQRQGCIRGSRIVDIDDDACKQNLFASSYYVYSRSYTSQLPPAVCISL
jgi:hypothetical protein